jgi:mRNA interferase MazF
LATAGDIVVVDFVGVRRIKRRPAVIISSDIYRQWRPDMIIGMLTGQVAKATAPPDYLLRDWQIVGLVKPTAFRAFLYTASRKSIIATIGHVTDHDWQEIVRCIRTAMAS